MCRWKRSRQHADDPVALERNSISGAPQGYAWTTRSSCPACCAWRAGAEPERPLQYGRGVQAPIMRLTQEKAFLSCQLAARRAWRIGHAPALT
jgi:hypothetical protein